ncbi:NAD-dependent epimerase/dehydratase family protein [Paenibacillus koleovorans]|uniref:NAD-dependent epimerase/dehydratase family protein n=1 Tax=Paenibacillus koleovorans TaxID=121608 RepID=UPI000FD9B305|nr:NAD-dependent epimerase/dehydratase family protein [Paenibacillus koleovorans]
MEKKVLVLGGTQFFGKRLVAKLVEDGADVTIATRGRTQDPFGDAVRRVQLDRQDRSSVGSALKTGEWDILYDQTCYAPKEAADVWETVNGRIGRYVFTSTMAVYELGIGKTEADFDPARFAYTLGDRAAYRGGMEGYRLAKREAEAYLFQQVSVPVTAVRFPYVIGPDDYSNRLRFLVERVCAGAEIGVADADAFLAFISSEEAASFLKWAGEADWSGPINAGSYGFITHRVLLERIRAIAGVGTGARFVREAEPSSTSPYTLPGSWTLEVSRASGLGFTFEQLDDYLPGLLRMYVDQLGNGGGDRD